MALSDHERDELLISVSRRVDDITETHLPDVRADIRALRSRASAWGAVTGAISSVMSTLLVAIVSRLMRP